MPLGPCHFVGERRRSRQYLCQWQMLGVHTYLRRAGTCTRLCRQDFDVEHREARAMLNVGMVHPRATANVCSCDLFCILTSRLTLYRLGVSKEGK